MGGRNHACGSALPGGPKIPVEFCERGVEQLASWDDDHIDSGGNGERVCVPEELPDETLRAIASDGIAELLGGDDAQTRQRTGMRRQQQREVSGTDAVAALESLLELAAPSHALRLREGVRRHARARLRARNGQALAPFCAPALQHEPAVLGGHPRQEAVSLLTATAVGLESALHVWSPVTVEKVRSKRKYYRLETSTVNRRAATWRAARDAKGGFWRSFGAVLHCPPCDARRVSPRRFPQLWKKLWKSLGFHPPRRRSHSEEAGLSTKAAKSRVFSAFVSKKRMDGACCAVSPGILHPAETSSK
jgi:hypothetical protein